MSGAWRRRALASAAAALLVLAAVRWWPTPLPPRAGGAAPPAQPGSVAAMAVVPLLASQVERGIEAARAAAQRNPDDASAWAMLAHSYEMVGRFDAATEAYAKLAALRPLDAQVLADYVDALGAAHQGKMQGEAARPIDRALRLDPRNLKALLLGGNEALARQDYAQALALWQRAEPVAGEPALKASLQTSIAEARALAAEPLREAASTPSGGAVVAGRVSVAAALQSQIAPDDTAFVFARPVAGSRMPVALLRRRARELPLDFALDDSLAMVPQSRLSPQHEVVVGVLVSRRGHAIPAPGDLEGELGPVAVGRTNLVLTIDHGHR